MIKGLIQSFNLFRLLNGFSSAKVTPNSQALRNIDYEQKRKSAVHQYNNQLKKEKESYLKQNNYLEDEFQKASDHPRKKQIATHFVKKKQQYHTNIANLELQLYKVLKSITHSEKTNIIKTYLADNVKEQGENSAIENLTGSMDKVFIPHGMVLKKLYHSQQKNNQEVKHNQQILLAGVDKQQDHCVFLKKIIEELDIKNVITMISPDMPFFIKTQHSFNHEWKLFLQDTNYAKKSKFYINPKPTCLKDICLHEHQIGLVKHSLAKSRLFLETYYYMMQENELSKKFEPNPFFAGFFAHSVQKIYFADYPAFQEREMIASKIELPYLRDLFAQHLTNFRKSRFNFSAQWLFPKEVLNKKLNHVIGITRAAAEQSEHRSILICPTEMAELISIQWQLNSQQGRLNYNYQDQNYYFNLVMPLLQNSEQLFIEYIQKLVILDLIMEPIIGKYFIKYRSFPFLCEHTIGGRQNIGKIFIIWMHYYKTYYEVLNQKRLSIDGSQERKQKIMQKYEQPKQI